MLDFLEGLGFLLDDTDNSSLVRKHLVFQGEVDNLSLDRLRVFALFLLIGAILCSVDLVIELRGSLLDGDL